MHSILFTAYSLKDYSSRLECRDLLYPYWVLPVWPIPSSQPCRWAVVQIILVLWHAAGQCTWTSTLPGLLCWCHSYCQTMWHWNTLLCRWQPALYFHADPIAVDNRVWQLVACIEEISHWMSANHLKLNTDKTQFIWLGTPYSRPSLSATPLQ